MVDIKTLKNELNITYQTDESIEQKLSGILSRSQKIIRDYAGLYESEMIDEADEELLLNLCRYIWNGAYEDFQKNFSAELLQIRAKYAVRRMTEDERENETVS